MRRRSFGTVKAEYAVPRRKIEQALEVYLKKIGTRVNLRHAILFGSYAKDTYSHGSDVDIAIIADRLPPDHKDRYVLLKDMILGVDIEPFAYTPTEWNYMLETDSGFAKEIKRHGTILYSAEH